MIAKLFIVTIFLFICSGSPYSMPGEGLFAPTSVVADFSENEEELLHEVYELEIELPQISITEPVEKPVYYQSHPQSVEIQPPIA